MSSLSLARAQLSPTGCTVTVAEAELLPDCSGERAETRSTGLAHIDPSPSLHESQRELKLAGARGCILGVRASLPVEYVVTCRCSLVLSRQ